MPPKKTPISLAGSGKFIRPGQEFGWSVTRVREDPISGRLGALNGPYLHIKASFRHYPNASATTRWPAPCFTIDRMKVVAQKVTKGGIDHFTLTIAPLDHSRQLRFCIWDALLLFTLFVGSAAVMRALLAS